VHEQKYYLLDEPVDVIHNIILFVQWIQLSSKTLMSGISRVMEYLAQRAIRCATTTPSED
jgi:hypothetical protein